MSWVVCEVGVFIVGRVEKTTVRLLLRRLQGVLKVLWAAVFLFAGHFVLLLLLLDSVDFLTPAFGLLRGGILGGLLGGWRSQVGRLATSEVVWSWVRCCAEAWKDGMCLGFGGSVANCVV